jgi:hypothetical protein
MVRNLDERQSVIGYFKKVVSGINLCIFSGLRVKIPACRMSGEMNTSLGNGFTNLMVYLFLMKYFGARDYQCVIEGDDCLGRFFPPKGKEGYTHAQLVFDLERLYIMFGMNVKITLFHDLCTASFCGLIFDRYAKHNIVDPLKVLLNIGWTYARYKNGSVKLREELLKGKGMSLLAQNAGCPIIQELACFILRVTANRKYRIDDYWLKARVEEVKDTMKPLPVQFGSRMVMEKVFGWTVPEQLAMEHFFQGMSKIEEWYHPIVLDHSSNEQIHYYDHYVHYRDRGNWPGLALPHQNN